MKAHNILNITRLYYLIRRHIFSNGKAWLIAYGAISGTLLVITLFRGYFQPADIGGLRSLYFVVMYISGFIFTAGIYGELHQPQRSYQYLTLPVSNAERLLSAWLITAFVFPIVALLTMAIIVFIGNLVMNLTLDITPFKGIFTAGVWSSVKVYIITQSMFLLGAAYFRGYNFLKTVLALFVVVTSIQIVAGLTGWILFGFQQDAPIEFGPQHMSQQMENLFLNIIPVAARIVFNYLFVPFFLITTYFSLKERQV